jgi:hypothetical protein
VHVQDQAGLGAVAADQVDGGGVGGVEVRAPQDAGNLAGECLGEIQGGGQVAGGVGTADDAGFGQGVAGGGTHGDLLARGVPATLCRRAVPPVCHTSYLLGE